MNRQFPLSDSNFSIIEAAEYLRVSRSKLYLLIAAGDLKSTKLGKRTLIRGSELQRLLDHLSAA
jgi:excisionase family DNA binding protein